MKEEGTVIELKGNIATIGITPKEECTGCSSCGAAKERDITVTVFASKDLRIGDHVEVDMDASSMMRIYILLYGIPLTVFVGTILLLHTISNSPIISFAGAIAATVISYIFLGIYVKGKPGFSPVICIKR